MKAIKKRNSSLSSRGNPLDQAQWDKDTVAQVMKTIFYSLRCSNENSSFEINSYCKVASKAYLFS